MPLGYRTASGTASPKRRDNAPKLACLRLEHQIGEAELWPAVTALAAPASRRRAVLHQSHTSYPLYAGRDFRRSFDEMPSRTSLAQQRSLCGA